MSQTNPGTTSGTGSNSPVLRIHYLVPCDDGVIASGGLVVKGPGGKPVQAAAPQSYRCACDPTLTLNYWDRGTGETWAVACKACSETEIFKENYRPHPREWPAADRAEEITVPAKKCGRCP